MTAEFSPTQISMECWSLTQVSCLQSTIWSGTRPTLSLRKYLLVPFRDNGHLTPVETAYNRAQARTRVDVERAIGLLKGKFRRLKDLEMTNIREVPMLIFSACVLHNFIIIENGLDEDDIDLSESEDEDEDGGQCGGDHCMSATQKRLEIANVFSWELFYVFQGRVVYRISFYEAELIVDNKYCQCVLSCMFLCVS